MYVLSGRKCFFGNLSRSYTSPKSGRKVWIAPNTNYTAFNFFGNRICSAHHDVSGRFLAYPKIMSLTSPCIIIAPLMDHPCIASNLQLFLFALFQEFQLHGGRRCVDLLVHFSALEDWWSYKPKEAFFRGSIKKMHMWAGSPATSGVFIGLDHGACQSLGGLRILMVKPRNTQSAMAHNEEINGAVEKIHVWLNLKGWNPTLCFGDFEIAHEMGIPFFNNWTECRNWGAFFRLNQGGDWDTVNWSKNLDIYLRERSELPLGLETSKTWKLGTF